MKNLWIVIPAYNESSVIRGVVENVRRLYSNIVVVDDASSDATYSEARSAGAVVLQHLINRGQGAALKTGMDYALQHGADIVVTFDSDGQHAVEDIERLVAPLTSGNVDVVLGSRFLGSTLAMPISRRFVLRAGVLFTRFFSNLHVTDTHNGLRAMTSDAVRSIRIVQDRMAHASEILEEIHRQNLRFTEVPVTIAYTEYSKTKGQSSLGMFTIAFKFLLGKLLR